jgi:hypothetical protein
MFNLSSSGNLVAASAQRSLLEQRGSVSMNVQSKFIGHTYTLCRAAMVEAVF